MRLLHGLACIAALSLCPAMRTMASELTVPTPTPVDVAQPAAAAPAAETQLASPPAPQQEQRRAPFGKARDDAQRILAEDNTCSRFFGGSHAALHVLNHLVSLMEFENMNDPKVGIVMSGEVTMVTNQKLKLSYRLFEKVRVNKRGGFNSEWFTHASVEEPVRVPKCGSFMPNTREARLLMMLHELAHLMRGQDGQWLIPNDGDKPDQSRQNTATIEANCKEQIKSLRK